MNRTRGTILSMRTFSIVLIFAAHVASAATDKSHALWEKAKQAFEHHDYKASITYANAVLKAHPEGGWPLYYGRAIAYAKLGRHDDAIADFNRAMRLNSHVAAVYIDRGMSYYLKGVFGEASTDFNRAIQIDPKSARAYRDRADLEDDMYLKDAALRDYNTALRLDPRYEDALYNRGNFYSSRGDNAKAIADYTKCLRLNPHNSDAKHNRAQCYRKQGQTGRAIGEFNDILKQNPRDICAFMARAEAYLAQHDRPAAIKDAKRAIVVAARDDEDFRCRANAAILLGQFRQASHDLKQACDHDRSSAAYLNSLAWLLATCRDSGVRNGRDAVALSRKACAMTGFRAPGYVGTLAAAYAEAGDFGQAVKYQELVLSLSKKKTEKTQKRLAMFRERKPYHSKEENE